jgi:Vitamin K-dependent gamma-carboxylase
MNTGLADNSKRGIRAQLREFFYAEEVPYGLALLRISISIAVLFAMLPRWPYARELYSSDGAPVPVWAVYGHAPLFPEPSGEVAVAIHSVLLLAAFTACLGLCTRFSMIVMTAGYVFLNSLDSLGTMNKYSVIASHLVFLLCFSQCGAVWSLDSWLRRSRLRRQGVPAEIADAPLRFAAWPRRLVQLFVGAVYIGAAVTKVKIPAYFTGEQLQTWMITSYNVPNPIGNYFAPYPALLTIFGLVCLVWECAFMFLAWRGFARIAMLVIGTTFHIMTLLTLGLWLFPVVCISAYFSFVNEADVAWFDRLFAGWRERGRGLAAAVGRLFRHRQWPVLPALDPAWAQAAFAILAVATACGGVAFEYKLDRYGMRRPEGPYALKELDPAYVAEELRPTERVRNEDKVLLFDIGSRVICGAIVDRKSVFVQGDLMKAECDLVPPHEDLWLTVELQDADHRIMDTTGSSMSADSMRTVFDYHLGESMPTGDYSLLLKIGGDEIIRRPFKLLATRHPAGSLAN